MTKAIAFPQVRSLALVNKTWHPEKNLFPAMTFPRDSFFDFLEAGYVRFYKELNIQNLQRVCLFEAVDKEFY
jgi:hypothetical protein